MKNNKVPPIVGMTVEGNGNIPKQTPPLGVGGPIVGMTVEGNGNNLEQTSPSGGWGAYRRDDNRGKW
jgi:hypothetical protein